jgi:DNA polymerase III epsilon subunit family exonuclease
MVFLIIFLIIVLIIGLIVQSLPYILIFAGLTITGTLVYRHIINQKKEAQEAEQRYWQEKEQREKEQRLYEQEQAHQRALKEAEKAKEDALKNAYRAFDDRLSTIPRHDIVIDPDNTRMRAPVFEEITVSNITQSTNLEKLGDFVAIDTETTGLSAHTEEIIELTAIRFRGWTPAEIFSTLINPGKHIPAEASKVNHITDDMVSDAPSIESVIKDFDVFIGKDNLLGHNISFDTKFLDAAGSEYASKKRKYYDTVTLARKIKWEVEPDNFKLDTLCDYYCIRDPKTGHRSSSDALATGILFKKLVDEKLS